MGILKTKQLNSWMGCEIFDNRTTVVRYFIQRCAHTYFQTESPLKNNKVKSLRRTFGNTGENKYYIHRRIKCAHLFLACPYYANSTLQSLPVLMLRCSQRQRLASAPRHDGDTGRAGQLLRPRVRHYPDIRVQRHRSVQRGLYWRLRLLGPVSRRSDRHYRNLHGFVTGKDKISYIICCSRLRRCEIKKNIKNHSLCYSLIT